jgi:hypothetical protein
VQKEIEARNVKDMKINLFETIAVINIYQNTGETALGNVHFICFVINFYNKRFVSEMNEHQGQ